MNRTSLSATAALTVLATSSLGFGQQPPAAAPEAPAPPAGQAPAAQPAPAAEQPAAPAAQPPAQAPAAPEPAPAEPPPAPPAAAAPTTAPPVEAAPEAAAPPVAAAPDDGSDSWFYRKPIEFDLSDDFRVTWYGEIQVNFIHDTTRSYGDSVGESLVAREDTFEGTKGRTQASARSTKFGLLFESPWSPEVLTLARLEADFSGDQPSGEVGASERAYYDSPTFRMRHAYLAVENPYVDVLYGQTDDVFGWQNTPSSTFRHVQFRLSRSFGGYDPDAAQQSSPVGLDVAAAALRPVQRDAQVPDAQAGLRFTFNDWAGVYTRDGIPSMRPLSLGVSGVVRQFDADAFTPPPTQSSNAVTGWGFSVDAVVPIISANNEYDRSNKLTLAGSYVTGTGIGDLMRVHGGAKFPPLPNPARASPAPQYEANVDEGLVTFDRLGVLNTIDWQGFRVDAQYYLPPSGKLRIAAIYTEAYSKNMDKLYPQGGAEIELLTHVADHIRYIEGNLFYDLTNRLRIGTAAIYTTVTYLDGEEPHNWRFKATGKYFF